MMSEAKLDVIRVQGLVAKMSTDAGAQQLFNRFHNANVAKSVINALLLDKDEEWERKELSGINGTDRILSMYRLICAGRRHPGDAL